MQESPNIKSTVSPYGLYMGIALSLLTIIMYSIYLEWFTLWWASIITFIILLVFCLLAINKAKSLSDQFSFKDAFTAYFIPIAIGTLISAVVNFVLFNLIDPEAAQYILEKGVANSKEMMQNMGGTQEQIEAIGNMETGNQYSLKNQFFGYISNLAFYAVIGLIIALIFKEKNTSNV